MRACAVRARLQLRAALLDLLAELLHVSEHLCVLVADALHHVEPPEQVVEVLRAENDLDGTAAVAVDVERPQPLCDVRLGGTEALLGDHEMARVRVEIGVDLGELLVREVVRLDRLLELRVRLLDLREHRLCLCPLRLDRGLAVAEATTASKAAEERRRGKEDGRSLSRSRTIHRAGSIVERHASVGGTRPKRDPSSAEDGCNRQLGKIPANWRFHSR